MDEGQTLGHAESWHVLAGRGRGSDPGTRLDKPCLAVLSAQRKMLRNAKRCDNLSPRMPLATAHKVEALRADFRSAAQLADMLGVSRSQVTRWLRGAGIDPLNAERVDLLELVWSNLLRIYEKDAALAWLFGVNPQLGDRRPIDLVRAGRTEELMRAIRAERADSFA
ncbi:MAG TPA: helix-turn-helix domain-containing protein [Candidatus Binatia bacterium]|nr:helix-turn-helix domain-containing protein [Candidatus Binatia bacterium]